jgi:hypothetical protein
MQIRNTLQQQARKLIREFHQAMEKDDIQQQLLVIGKISGFSELRRTLAPTIGTDQMTTGLNAKAKKRLIEIQRS